MTLPSASLTEAILRLACSETSGIVNLGGWLTTVGGRVRLDMLRSRTSRDEVSMPEPIVSREDGIDLTVLDDLGPAPRPLDAPGPNRDSRSPGSSDLCRVEAA